MSMQHIEKNAAMQGEPVTLFQDAPTFDPESEQIGAVLERLNQTGYGQVSLAFHSEQNPVEQFGFATNFFAQLNELCFQMLGKGLIAGAFVHVQREDKCAIQFSISTIDLNLAQDAWNSFNA